MPYVHVALIAATMGFVTPTLVHAEYITREQQRDLAQEHLRDHQNPNKFDVSKSSPTVSGIPPNGSPPPSGGVPHAWAAPTLRSYR